MYSPQTILTLTVGNGVFMFTLNLGTGEYILTKENIRIPVQTQEFAINMSNMRHWEAPVQKYVQELLAGDTGPLGKNFNMRWVAARLLKFIEFSAAAAYSCIRATTAIRLNPANSV